MGGLLFSSKSILNFSFLLSNKVNIKSITQHKLKLFGVLSDMQHVKADKNKK